MGSILANVAGEAEKSRAAAAVAASAPVKRYNPLTSAVNGLPVERETGIEPATTSLGS